MTYDSREKKAMAAAYLLQTGRKQEEIKDALDLRSQTDVSRLIKLAKERKWLTWQLNIPEEELPEIRAKAYPRLKELNECVDDLARTNKGVHVSRISVLHSRDSDSPEERMARFGQQAADHVMSLLRDPAVHVCAVAWGRTVKSLVDAIQPQSKKLQHVQFVPVSGEPGRFPFDSISPTQAAERLATAFGTRWLSLNGVAARIPKSLAGKADVIRQFVRGCKDYEAILGGPEPIIGKASLILSGIGNARSSRDDAWFKETAHLEEISDVQKIAAGNIGGVWIPERDEYDRRIKEINERSLGIQREHFEHCAHAGTRSGLGVVVLALEPEKARIIKRAVGLINHLIIDESLADAILGESTAQEGDVSSMPLHAS